MSEIARWAEFERLRAESLQHSTKLRLLIKEYSDIINKKQVEHNKEIEHLQSENAVLKQECEKWKALCAAHEAIHTYDSGADVIKTNVGHLVLTRYKID